MDICFDGLKTGTFCLGDPFVQVRASEFGMTHAGIAILAIIALAIAIFVFRDPA